VKIIGLSNSIHHSNRKIILKTVCVEVVLLFLDSDVPPNDIQLIITFGLFLPAIFDTDVK
jgi:hypothetical protein